MKSFVVFSDLHLHQWQYGATLIDGKNSRLEQQKDVVKSIVRYCKEREIPEVVFCGDLFHTHTVTAEVSQAAYEAFKGFKENKIDLTIVVGNHDQASRSGGTHSLSFFREIGRVIDTNVATARAGSIANQPATFLPYTDSLEQLRGWLDRFRSGLLFMHQGVGGVEVNSKGFVLNEILTPDLVPDACLMGFSGHYHTHKSVTGNLVIPGSTVQLNWGDQGETRGWLDVKVDGDDVSFELVPSGASEFVSIPEDKLDDNVHLVPGNFIRVLSKGDYSPEEITQWLMGNGAASVEIRQEIVKQAITKIEAKSMLSFNEVVLQYATAKEHAGVINAYDKEIGEELLKGNYNLPSV